MKRILAILVLAAVCIAASAQTVSYKELKNVYNPKDYVKSDVDPYQVFWIGLESFAAPGTGQLIMRETGRGWMFIGASTVLAGVNNHFVTNLTDLAVKGPDGKYTFNDADKDKVLSNFLGLLGVSLVETGLCVWSCVDAVKIAKVKNQYYQDNTAKQVSATLYPSFDLVQSGTGTVPVTGMTFAVTF